MQIPTQRQWLQDTNAGVLKPRSSKLKAVDMALLNYELAKNEQNLWRLKNAFEDWKRDKMNAWEQSDRNKKGAVKLLDTELNRVADYRTYQITHMDIKELQALAFMGKERKKAIAQVFEGKKVTFKLAKTKDRLIESAKSAKENSLKAASYMKSIGKGQLPKTTGKPISETIKEKMEGMVKSFFGVETLAQIGELSGLILNILGEFAVQAPPWVGHVKDGYDMFVGFAKAGSAMHEEFSIWDRHYAIDTGAPSAAFDGLMKCLEKETNSEMFSLTTATTSFALKTGLFFADGGVISGPVVGAAKAMADVSQALFLLGLEFKATRAVNTQLKSGDLDIRLFRSYPLMGCYFLIGATLSDLIPVESFGTPGWMDYIEHLKKNSFDNIYESSVGLVEKSPWEILGLPKRPKGTSLGLLGEAKRMWSTVSPLADLKDLIGLKS